MNTVSSRSDSELAARLPKKQHLAAPGHGYLRPCVYAVGGIDDLIKAVIDVDSAVFRPCDGDRGIGDAV